MIRKTLLYLLIVTASLYAVRYLHYHGLLRQTRGYYAKFKTAFFEKNSYDVLFLGSSRVEMHYDTRMFDSITGKNSFNLGLSGATPDVALAALKAYLANSKAPAFLFYELDFHTLRFNSGQIRDFNNYFPFFANTTLKREFNRIDPRMNHFYYDPFYSLPFSGLKNISTSLHGWLKLPNLTDNLYYKGFLHENFGRHLDVEPVKPYSAYIHTCHRACIDSIIGICRANGTRLTLVTSPMFAGGEVDLLNKKQVVAQIGNLARINRLSYINLSQMPFCTGRDYFIDHYHMTYKGTILFTRELSRLFNNKIAPVSLNTQP